MTNITALGVKDERIKITMGGNALIPFSKEQARLMLEMITDRVRELRKAGDIAGVLEFEAMNCNFMAAQLLLSENEGRP